MPGHSTRSTVRISLRREHEYYQERPLYCPIWQCSLFIPSARIDSTGVGTCFRCSTQCCCFCGRRDAHSNMNTCPAIINQRLRRAQTLEVRIPISQPRHRQAARAPIRRPTFLFERPSGLDVASILFQGRPLVAPTTQLPPLATLAPQRRPVPEIIPQQPPAPVLTTQQLPEAATGVSVQTTATVTTPAMDDVAYSNTRDPPPAINIVRRSTLVRGTTTLGQLIIESGDPGPHSAADIERWHTPVGCATLAEFRATEDPDNQDFEINLIARIHQRLSREEEEEEEELLAIEEEESFAIEEEGSAHGVDEGESSSSGEETDEDL